MTDAAQPTGLVSEAQPFWDAAARGVLLIKRCIDTARFFFYPRERSPFTGGETEWVEVSGRGTVYSCSLSLRPKPCCLAYVKLEEGPIVLTQIESENLAAIAIGQAVRVEFRDLGGKMAPIFIPTE